MELTRDLNFICMATENRNPGLPSWAPDWTASDGHRGFFLNYFYGEDRSAGTDIETRKWPATRGSRCVDFAISREDDEARLSRARS